MKIWISFMTLLSVFVVSDINCQTDFVCGTQTSHLNNHRTQTFMGEPPCGNEFRIQIYVIRNSDGSNGADIEIGFTPEQFSILIYQELNESFDFSNYDPQGSPFAYGGDFEFVFRDPSEPIIYIDDDQLYNAATTNIEPYFEADLKCDAINIYLKSTVLGGVANNLCNSNFSGVVVSANSEADMIGILLHEIGHVFGLFHTFDNSCQFDVFNEFFQNGNGVLPCEEVEEGNPLDFGSNCDELGDFVCDTYPVPSNFTAFCDIFDLSLIPNTYYELMPIEEADLDLENLELYPEFPFMWASYDQGSNYMQYTFPSCLNHYTPGQSIKMNNHIEINPALQRASCDQVGFYYNIQGSNCTEANGSIQFTLFGGIGYSDVICIDCPEPSINQGFFNLSPGTYTFQIIENLVPNLDSDCFNPDLPIFTEPCVIETIELNIPIDNTDCTPTLIMVNTIWNNQTMSFCEDVIVSAGISLKIENQSFITFAEGAGIILLEGADLTIENSTLTNQETCSEVWQGISATRNLGTYNSNPSLIWVSNSEIQNAIKAVALYTSSFFQTNNITWAFLRIDNSEFSNNIEDIGAQGSFYNFSGTSIAIVAMNSDFIIESDFEPSIPINSKISLNFINSSTFQNCRVLNHNDELFVEAEITAFNLFDSGLNLKATMQPEPGQQSESRVEGFMRGLTSVGTMDQIRVENTDFSCWRGIYARNNFSNITANRFWNLPLTMQPALNDPIVVSNSLAYITPDQTNNQIGPYGLYLDGGTSFFQAISNEFNVTYPALNGITNGMLVNNTGQLNNLVADNYFTGMQRALVLQGNNRNSNFLNGTKYECNVFEANLLDIRELLSIFGNPTLYGVPHQGTSELDPSNTFTQSSQQFDDIYNSNPTHNYYKIFGSSEPELSEVSPFVLLLEAQQQINCDQVYFGEGEMEFSSISQNIDENVTEYSELRTMYYSIVDDGDTELLKYIIENTDYSEALNTHYNLIDASPNLSKEVMLKALDEYDLPNVLLTEILASNPTAAKSDEIKNAIENRLIPFEEYQKSMIMEGVDILSNKEAMESELSNLLSNHGYLMRRYMEIIFADSTILNKHENILDKLNPELIPNDFILEVLLASQFGQYSQALSKLQNIPSNLKLSDSELLDLALLQQMIELESEVVLNGYELGAEDFNFLWNQLNTGPALVSERALDLLISKNQINYIHPIITENEFDRSSVQSTNGSNFSEQFHLFPNPFNEILSYYNSDRKHVASFQFFDFQGKLISLMSVDSNEISITIDTLTLPKGNYIVLVYDQNQELLEKQKCIKY